MNGVELLAIIVVSLVILGISEIYPQTINFVIIVAFVTIFYILTRHEITLQ